jgi:hypothetical protein
MSSPQRDLFIEYHHLYGRQLEFLALLARGLGALAPSDEGQARRPRNALSTYGLSSARSELGPLSVNSSAAC